MQVKAAPVRAVLMFPVDGASAVRLTDAGLDVDYPSGRTFARVSIELKPNDPLVALVADYADPVVLGDEIRLDLSEGPRVFVDETPPIPPPVPGPSRHPLWSRPSESNRYKGAVHLRADQDVADLPAAVEAWLKKAVPTTTVHRGINEAIAAWKEQGRRMVSHATDVVRELEGKVTTEEWHGLVSKLGRLADQARDACDGGLDPTDLDFEVDDYGERFLRPAHWYVNEAYSEVLDACDRITNADSSRSRGQQVQDELSWIVNWMSSEVPDRYRKAGRVGVLPSLLGSARNELLPVVWPGWAYLTENHALRQVANPSEALLDELIDERGIDKDSRQWPHDPITLQWHVGKKQPVLASSFLGKTIYRPCGSDT